MADPPVSIVEPVPGHPAARRTRRRLWFGGIGAFLLAALGCGWAATERVIDAASAVGGWLAGMGTLSWRRVDGEWVEVASADALRRNWGPQDAFLEPAWAEIAPGLALADLAVRRSPNPQTIDLVLARILPRYWRFRVVGTPDWSGVPIRTLGEGFSLAVNAAYFSDEGPLGLVISDGVRRHRAVSHRAAHFLVDGPGAPPRIVNRKRTSTEGVEAGFQGFPGIMSNALTYSYMRVGGRGFDVWDVDRRTAACVTRDGAVVLLVTDSLTNGLSFDELATVLGGLGCADAMGFDGGTSTGLVVNVPGHERLVPNLKGVPVVLGITPR